jgi:hypothetical protein
MTYKTRYTFEEVERILQIPCRTLLREMGSGEEVYQDLLNAQNSQTVLAWSRDLYGLPDTGNVTLSVNATTKVISCRTGANYFAGFQIGRDVQITNFTNAGNNQTTEITAQSNDSITVGDATGLVDETDDPNARVQQNPTQEQQDSVTAVVNTALSLHELYGALTNVATTTADRAAKLRDFT